MGLRRSGQAALGSEGEGIARIEEELELASGLEGVHAIQLGQERLAGMPQVQGSVRARHLRELELPHDADVPVPACLGTESVRMQTDAPVALREGCQVLRTGEAELAGQLKSSSGVEPRVPQVHGWLTDGARDEFVATEFTVLIDRAGNPCGHGVEENQGRHRLLAQPSSALSSRVQFPRIHP